MTALAYSNLGSIVADSLTSPSLSPAANVFVGIAWASSGSVNQQTLATVTSGFAVTSGWTVVGPVPAGASAGLAYFAYARTSGAPGSGIITVANAAGTLPPTSRWQPFTVSGDVDWTTGPLNGTPVFKQGTTATSDSITLPVGAQYDDLIIEAIANRNNATAPTVDALFTQVVSDNGTVNPRVSLVVGTRTHADSADTTVNAGSLGVVAWTIAGLVVKFLQPARAAHAAAGATGAAGPNKIMDVQIYDVAGGYSWNKPAGARRVKIIVQASGGGGGGGGRQTTSIASCGGGGGAAGAYQEWDGPADDLSSSCIVGLGSAGPGGSAGASNSTTGGDGNPAADAYVVDNATGQTLAYSIGGSGGLGGLTVGSAGGGSSSASLYPAGAGSTSSATIAPPAGGSSTWGASGGGAGASVTASNAGTNSGAGGSKTLVSNVAANGPPVVAVQGGAGTSLNPPTAHMPGFGGAGGGHGNAGAAGSGGNGTKGAGGGGGGGARNGFAAGNGGNGGLGFIIIVSYK